MTGSGAASRPGDSRRTQGTQPPLAAVRKILANGLRVVLAENHTVPLVWLNWVLPAGFEWDPPALAGVAAMTPACCEKAPLTAAPTRLREDVDDLGANLVAGADWDAAFLNLELLVMRPRRRVELLIDMAWPSAVS